LWKNLYYELSTYLDPITGFELLKTEAPKETQPELPPFVKIIREVSDQKDYASSSIALKQKISKK